MRCLTGGASVVLAVTLLSACGGAPAPAATGRVPALPAPATQSVPSVAVPAVGNSPAVSTPTSTAAALPSPTIPQAFPATREGALALVRAVYQVLDDGYRTNDVTRLHALVDPGCVCLKVEDFLSDLRSKQQHIVGGGYLHLRIQDFVQSGNFATVSAFYETKRGEVRDSAGHVAAVIYARSESQDSVTLERRNSFWALTSISNLTRGATRK